MYTFSTFSLNIVLRNSKRFRPALISATYSGFIDNTMFIQLVFSQLLTPPPSVQHPAPASYFLPLTQLPVQACMPSRAIPPHIPSEDPSTKH